MKICQKWIGVHSLELFGANSTPFQVKKLSSKTLVTLLEEAQFISSNLNERVAHKK